MFLMYKQQSPKKYAFLVENAILTFNFCFISMKSRMTFSSASIIMFLSTVHTGMVRTVPYKNNADPCGSDPDPH
jgi:hypothetical protein